VYKEVQEGKPAHGSRWIVKTRNKKGKSEKWIIRWTQKEILGK
jgi:hypothetical protein